MGSGGMDSSAQKEQIKFNQETLDLLERQTELGRRDITKTADPAIQAMTQGQQQSIDMYGQSVPEQFRAVQQGNQNAQNQLISGGNQMYNALMGKPIDGSAFQVRNVNPDFGYLNQQVVTPPNVADLLAFTPEELAQQQTRLDLLRDTRQEYRNLLDDKISTTQAINSWNPMYDYEYEGGE